MELGRDNVRSNRDRLVCAVVINGFQLELRLVGLFHMSWKTP